MQPKQTKHKETYASLMKNIMGAVKPDMAPYEKMLEYVNVTADNNVIGTLDFRLMPYISYGGNEGIYIHVHVVEYGRDGAVEHQIGTIKTLYTGKAASKAMGELAGLIIYHGKRYIDRNLHKF